MSKVITAAKHVWSAKDQITRNIWLAGLGAYDKGYESASNTVTKSQSIFDELVERGRKLESDTTQTLFNQKDKLTSASQNATDAIQGKVHSAVSNLTNIDASTFDNIIDKIEQIESALAEATTTEQVQEAAPQVEAVKEAIEIVEAAVTEKVASVAAEVTAVVENVAEAVTQVVTQVTPVIAKPIVKEVMQDVVQEVTEQVATVKQTAKKVTNRRVKKNVAKKK
ncbi:phasin-related domain-containing protein [Moritella dasanensis]|uniref:phasin-related domain-containing protein n=1 Tax=Moritella dasanensis TaxID=428031 RepID=UPI0002F1B5D1|nr:phasin family protein [Moritella dasanensis]